MKCIECDREKNQDQMNDQDFCKLCVTEFEAGYEAWLANNANQYPESAEVNVKQEIKYES